jgi:hypothetical protein
MQANKPLEIIHLEVFAYMRDVVFIYDSTSSGNDLEIPISERMRLT